MLEPGARLDDRYRIDAVLGRGGFGHVFRATDELTDEPVAIKELVPGLVGDPHMVQRFIQEARATMRLTHPNIARTYNVFQSDGTYYLVLEYLAGGSLADRLTASPLSVDVSLRVAAAISSALNYAHGQGVVHCDIKPGNVLLGEGGGVHLADFGIAYVSDEMMTRQVRTGTGLVMGTVRYMAPEQLDGVRDDPRVDIYAVGALLYEMLAGRPYLEFESETTPAAQMRNMQRIQTEPPRPLRVVNPEVPPWLAHVVTKALSKAPEQRYPSARALREALQPPEVGQDTGPVVPVPVSVAVPTRLVLPDSAEVALVAGSLTLGRDPSSDVVLDDEQVSRHHAIIHVTENEAQIVDLGSTNGTFINSERLPRREPRPLSPGDTLQLGSVLLVQVLAGAAVTPPPAAPPPPPGLPPVPPETVLAASAVPQRGGLPAWLWALVAAAVVMMLCFGAALVWILSGTGTAEATPTSSATAQLAVPTATFTRMATPTNTATYTPTSIPSATGAPTVTGTNTWTPIATATGTATSTTGASGTPSPSPSISPTPTATPSPTPSETPTPTATPTPSETPTPTPTATEAPAPTIEYFRADPGNIVAGECTTLSWGAVTEATEARIEPDVGPIGTPGSQAVCPTEMTEYVLTALGPGGTSTASVTVSVTPAQADLTVEAIQFDPDPPVQDRDNAVRIRISNVGTGPAGAFDWEWQPGTAVPLGGSVVSGLAAGASTEVVVTWRPASWYGDLPTAARVDTGGAVAESDEGNNERQVNTQVVKPPLPDLTIESVSFDPMPPVQDRDNEVGIAIRNQGPEAAGPFDWEWQPGSSMPFSGSVAGGLDAGETVMVVVVWHPASWYGNLPTVARADVGDSVAEGNEGNNEYRVNVQVVRPP